jgi:hypothetical protein
LSAEEIIEDEVKAKFHDTSWRNPTRKYEQVNAKFHDA